MAKLTRRQKIALQQQKGKDIPKKPKDKYVNPISVKKIFQKNWWFMLALVVLCVGIYFNSLDNELTLVDDIQGIVHHKRIPDLNESLKTLKLRVIFYSVSYQFFEYNPLPYRINSVFLHTATTLIGFLLVYLLYDRKTAMIAWAVFRNRIL